MIYRKLGLLLLLLSAHVPAGSGAISHYRVEIVVFESADKRRLQSEHWPGNPGAPSLEGVLELEGSASGGAPDWPCEQQSAGCQPRGYSVTTLPNGQEHDFHLLPATEYRLQGMVKSLEASGQYRPLVHLAWQQPAFSQEQALAVHIAGGWPRTARMSAMGGLRSAVHYVEGSFLLYRGRYLHGVADLVLYRSEPTQVSRAPQSAFGERQHVTSEPTQPLRFRLNEHRRMRSGEVHYLDHPLFGVLVQVLPYQGPIPSAPAPDDSEPQDEEESPLEAEEIEPVEGDED